MHLQGTPYLGGACSFFPYFCPMNTIPQHICFIVAMAEEAAPLIKHFALHEIEKPFSDFLPMKIFTSDGIHPQISLVLNGHDENFDVDNIGTQAAVLSSFLAIEHLSPDLIINAGTAGGFQEKGLEIGDVVLARDRVWFHDRRIPIPKFNEYGLGGYPIEALIDESAIPGLKSGVISTGNSFDFTTQDLELMNELNVSIKDMEAAAIAWTCQLAGIPLIIIKGVTDFVGFNHVSEVQFMENFRKTTENLADICVKVVKNMLS